MYLAVYQERRACADDNERRNTQTVDCLSSVSSERIGYRCQDSPSCC